MALFKWPLDHQCHWQHRAKLFYNTWAYMVIGSSASWKRMTKFAEYCKRGKIHWAKLS